MAKIKYAATAKFLRKKSKEICKDNECKEDAHKCGSVAYFNEDGLADICNPDYASRQYWSYVSLPFAGFGADLEREIEGNKAEV